MTMTRRRWVVLAAVVAMLVGGGFVVYRMRAPEVDLSTDFVVPGTVRLTLAERFVFHPKQLVGSDHYHFLSGRDGEFWVLLRELMQPLKASRVTEEGQSPFERIGPPDWNGVDRVSVTNDRIGRPVVFMMGYVGDARNSSVVVVKGEGGKWTKPIELDRFDGSGTFGDMLSLLDAKGHMHVVYDRHLTPRESYSRGFIIVDGEFPDKCFHAFWDGHDWVKAKPTTGRGRFGVDLKLLRQMPGGRVCLGMKVHPFGAVEHKPNYLGFQVWDGAQWSAITRQDPWGESCTILSSPLTVQDASGRIITCSSWASGSMVRVWNGKTYVGHVLLPGVKHMMVTQILSNPEGSIYVLSADSPNIVVQRVRMITAVTGASGAGQ